MPEFWYLSDDMIADMGDGPTMIDKWIQKDRPFGNCEVCGKPARHIVRDVREVYSEVVRQFEPMGPPHKFCDEHKRESKTYDLNGNLA